MGIPPPTAPARTTRARHAEDALRFFITSGLVAVLARHITAATVIAIADSAAPA
jgi:hypothetical protein